MRASITFLFCCVVLVSQAQKKYTLKVSTAAELQSALNNAQPNQTIQLNDGIYVGQFKVKAGISGTKDAPIVLQGSSKAILQTGSVDKGYGLQLNANNYWILKGFSVTESKKAIMIDSSNYVIVDGITIENIGEEGVHFRKFSSFNTMTNCKVTNTGLLRAGYGEACYIGSAKSNWDKYTAGNPDTCNYNIVTNNVFGPNVSAEHIDIKEGTKGGYIAGNTFNGTGMKTENYSDSWMDIKGCDYVIENNKGYNALLDGFQVHIPVEGAGARNIFRNNTCVVNAKGFGFNIQKLKGSDNGNVVYDNNVVINAEAGVANINVTSGK